MKLDTRGGAAARWAVWIGRIIVLVIPTVGLILFYQSKPEPARAQPVSAVSAGVAATP